MRVGLRKLAFFSADTSPYLRLAVIRPRLLTISNRKLHTRFRLLPKSTTLDDPERYHVRCFKVCLSKIVPFYQQQNVALVSGSVRLNADIREVSLRGASKRRFLADRTIGRAFVTGCRLSVCLSSVVCDVLYPGKTAGPICMKFSGKVWTDHGTT